jgi:hypothetical protein
MLLLCIITNTARAQDIDDQPDTQAGVGFAELTPELNASVERGLAILATYQSADGSFGAPRYPKHVGITALSCLAFMADGHLPGRGRYGPQVERGLEFILRSAQETGLIAADNSHGPMYGHGFATLFLGEVYGMTAGPGAIGNAIGNPGGLPGGNINVSATGGDPRVREALVKAVRLIVNTQNREGGWRYQPVAFDADVSVTICQVMGLRSARNAGLSVPKATIDRAIAYVRLCQSPEDGGFRYMANAAGSAFPRSAAGVASLYYAGVYQDAALEKGLDYLMRSRRNMSDRAVGHYFYGQYYAVQAMYLAGGKYWADWFPWVRQDIIAQQDPAGNWNDPNGEAYATAMAVLVLQLPKRMLPIFQR